MQTYVAFSKKEEREEMKEERKNKKEKFECLS